MAVPGVRRLLVVADLPADDRYETMTYRRCGRRGLQLPMISLGLWHNFGDDRPFATQQAICRRAFDLGVTHFDLANNYGPPYGAAEESFGRLLAIVRALREQIDWDVIRRDVEGHPYAKAFLYLADELGLTDAPRVVDVDVEPGRAAAPTGSDGD